MTTLIENAVTLADIAKATKGTAAHVEADCHELSLFVGSNWSGAPALSTVDAHAYVSGSARRDAAHADAHTRWRAASEAWEADREAVRRTAYNDCFDTARRRGVGDPAAAHEAAQVASAAVVAFERKTPEPTFGDWAPSRLSQVKTRVKEVVR